MACSVPRPRFLCSSRGNLVLYTGLGHQEGESGRAVPCGLPPGGILCVWEHSLCFCVEHLWGSYPQVRPRLPQGEGRTLWSPLPPQPFGTPSSSLLLPLPALALQEGFILKVFLDILETVNTPGKTSDSPAAFPPVNAIFL